MCNETNQEINDAEVQKMTQEDYIKQLENKIDQLTEVCESAFEKSRFLEERMSKMEREADRKLALIKDNVRVMANNVMTIIQ